MKLFFKLFGIVFFLFNSSLIAQDIESCTAEGCHENLTTLVNIHPAIEDDCTTCHESSNTDHPSGGTMDFTLTDIMPDLCFACHDENNTQKYLHAPIEFGECIDCHSPHSSDGDYLLKEISVAATCSQCHDLLDEKGRFHEPVKSGYCTDCHSPHQSNNNSLLLEESPQLCFNCHGDLDMSESQHNIHPPFEEDCLNCHNPHISKMEFLLEEDLPELCFTCHENPAEDEKMVTVHGAISEGKKCASCHSPHSSENSYLVIKEEPQLCTGCHNKNIVLEDRTIPNIESKIMNEELAHPPAIDDGCTTCHNPHASEYSSLLSEKFPTTNYSEGVGDHYNLCFSCHDKSMIEQELTEEATGFRTGDKNLHFLHVNREKSRTCINCHDVHGSKNEYLIADEMQFGKIKMKLNFNISEKGGSCLPGCHQEYSYNR